MVKSHFKVRPLRVHHQLSIENQHQWSAKSKRVKEEESKRVRKNVSHLELLKGFMLNHLVHRTMVMRCIH